MYINDEMEEIKKRERSIENAGGKLVAWRL